MESTAGGTAFYGLFWQAILIEIWQALQPAKSFCYGDIHLKSPTAGPRDQRYNLYAFLRHGQIKNVRLIEQR